MREHGSPEYQAKRQGKHLSKVEKETILRLIQQGKLTTHQARRLMDSMEIKNYLKTAFRTFRKRKIFTFFNVVGLSIGISASLTGNVDLVIFCDRNAIRLVCYEKWMQDFADKTPISWWIFGLSGAAGMLLTALFTLSFQTIKAAIANPVKSLKTE
jgi:hypothetical protein